MFHTVCTRHPETTHASGKARRNNASAMASLTGLRSAAARNASRSIDGSLWFDGRNTSRGGAMQLESILTCPNCGFQAAEQMPLDACQFFYDCKGCGERLKPKAGDCCVFCSYGSVPCPPVQQDGGRTCCG